MRYSFTLSGFWGAAANFCVQYKKGYAMSLAAVNGLNPEKAIIPAGPVPNIQKPLDGKYGFL
jgi:hypothetical protein